MKHGAGADSALILAAGDVALDTVVVGRLSGANPPSEARASYTNRPMLRPVPCKANADRRHYIPKQRHRVPSSAEYDAALRQRGSLASGSRTR